MQFWITTRWVGLCLALLLAVLCWGPASGLVFEQNIETMFADHDPLVPAWRQFKELFGGQEVLLATYAEATPLAADTWPRLKQLTSELQTAVSGLRVQSVSTTPLGQQITSPDSLLGDRLLKLLTGYLISADRQTLAVVCILPPWNPQTANSPGEHRAQVVDRLEAVVSRYPQGTLAGEPVMLVQGFRLLEFDGQRLESVSLILILLTLYICFRSWRWVLIPLLLIWLTLLTTRAALAVSGYRLTMVSSMLSAMLTIVAVATVVHLIVRYQAELRAGYAARQALDRAVRALFWPICGAIATDLIGFGTLALSRVGPVHDFGLMTAFGTALVIPLGALLIPAITLVGTNATTTSHPSNELPVTPLGNRLAGLWQVLEQRPRTWLTLILLLALLVSYGLSKIEIETDFTRNFRNDSPLVHSYDFVETRLGGAGVWDLLVPVPAEMTLADWDRLRNFQSELRALKLPGESDTTTPALTKVLSLVDVLDAMTLDKLVQRPDGLLNRMTLVSSLLLLRQELPDLINALDATSTSATGKQRWLRIMLRAKERMPAQTKAQIIAQVRELADRTWNQPATTSTSSPAKTQVTGFYVLLAGLIESLQQDQWVTFLAATLGIWLLLAICLRSPMLALIALVPNVLSILILLGSIGWLGVRANMGTAMIAAVSMGLAVDASIHFLVAYQRLRRSGLTVSQAIVQVEQGTGPAMVWATLALVVGFSSLCTSEFVPTIHFGALSSLTMLGGMLGNLVVLPLLVWLWEHGLFHRGAS